MEPYASWAVVALATAAAGGLSLVLGALRSYSLARLEAALRQDPGRFERVKALLQDEDRLVIAVTSLRGLVLVAGMVALTGAFIGRTVAATPLKEIGPLGWLLCGAEAALVGAALFVAVGHTIPHAIGEGRAEGVLLRGFRLVRAVQVASLPLAWLFGGLHKVALRVANVAEEDEAAEIKDELLSAALAGQSEGVFDETAKDVIENLIEFRDAAVAEVMTPRIEMVTVDQTESLEAVVAKALEHSFSRIPVVDGHVDRVTGVLMVKDLLRAVGKPDADWRAHIRPPIFVPETKRVADLLRELRTKKMHLAIVADEYGGTAGLVTIEDLVEELIGEIDDEHDTTDQSEVPLRRLTESELDVDGKLAIEELNEEAGTRLPEDSDVETVGGFVAMRLGKIPVKGDKLTYNGYAFTVTDADERRARRLRIKIQATV